MEKNPVRNLARAKFRASIVEGLPSIDYACISCLETPPIELQEREPDFKETDGMELWAIKQRL
jgi:hypothetical protein